MSTSWGMSIVILLNSAYWPGHSWIPISNFYRHILSNWKTSIAEKKHDSKSQTLQRDWCYRRYIDSLQLHRKLLRRTNILQRPKTVTTDFNCRKKNSKAKGVKKHKLISSVWSWSAWCPGAREKWQWAAPPGKVSRELRVEQARAVSSPTRRVAPQYVSRRSRANCRGGAKQAAEVCSSTEFLSMCD